jgi:hypothetical protein
MAILFMILVGLTQQSKGYDKILDYMKCKNAPKKMHFKIFVKRDGKVLMRNEVWIDRVSDSVFVYADSVETESKAGVSTGTAKAFCKNSIRKGYTAYFEYSDNPSRRIVEFFKNNDEDPAIAPVNIRWECIGCILKSPDVLSTSMMNRQLEMFAKVASMESSTHKFNQDQSGNQVYELTVGKRIIPNCKYTFDSHGRLMSLETNSDKYTEISTATYNKNSVFFLPDRVSLERKNLANNDVRSILVEFTDINEAAVFSANQFSLESFRLPDDTLLAFPEIKDPSKYPVWKNQTQTKETAMDRMKAAPFVPATPSTPRPSLISQAWPYFLGFVVFAVLGFWLIRKQRKAAKEG